MREFLITVALVQLGVWAVTTIVPMPEKVKQVVYVVDVVFVVFLALRLFNAFPR